MPRANASTVDALRVAPSVDAAEARLQELAGKAEFADFFKLEANALFADYMDNAAKFQDDHFNTMIADIPRATYVIGGTTYVTRPVGEVMPEFDRIVTSPKARRAISILMSQTSAPPLSQVQVQIAAPRNALRQQPLDTATLPGAGAFVSRSSKMPPAAGRGGK